MQSNHNCDLKEDSSAGSLPAGQRGAGLEHSREASDQAGPSPFGEKAHFFDEKSPLQQMPWLRQIQSEHEMALLMEAARADGHGVISATHLVQKDGELVGYASIGAVPLLFTWLHTKKVRARETLGLLNTVEAVAAGKGARLVCMPCEESSPLFKYMESFGCTPAGGPYRLFYKRLA